MIEARTKTNTVNSRVETEVKIAMLLESVPQTVTVPEQSSLVVNSGRERWKQDVHLNLAFAHKRFVLKYIIRGTKV